MFAPLVDVDYEMGPTEVKAGTHLPCQPTQRPTLDLSSYICQDRTGDTVVAEMKAGSALLFDLRTLHRGGENKSDKRRPQIYAAYVQDFFIDTVRRPVTLRHLTNLTLFSLSLCDRSTLCLGRRRTRQTAPLL